MSHKESKGLFIGYNGVFLADSSKEKYEKSGVVLTRGGRVFVRDSKKDHWDDVATSSIFLFRDNETESTYLVDKNKKSIAKANLCGRVLDCTDRVVYEIDDCKWSPVCDLSAKTTRTIVRCSHLSACQSTGPISVRQVSAKLLNRIVKKGGCDPCEPIEVDSLPGRELTIPFEVLGCDARILCEFSEIDSDLVDLCNGFLSVDAVAPGECAVLVYQTCLCDETVIVAQLFIREGIAPRFSAKCGQFVPADAPVATPVAPPFDDPLCPEPDPCLIPIESIGGLTTNLYQLQNWSTIYQVPESQLTPGGVWTVPETGDYEVKAEIHLCSARRLPVFSTSANIRTTYFVLVRYPVEADPVTIPGVIAACAPLENNLNPTGVTFQTEDRLESANASFDIGLRLNAGEKIIIYYVEDIIESFTRTLPPIAGSPGAGYQTVRCGTTFNANFLGCAPSTPFPVPQ